MASLQCQKVSIDHWHLYNKTYLMTAQDTLNSKCVKDQICSSHYFAFSLLANGSSCAQLQVGKLLPVSSNFLIYKRNKMNIKPVIRRILMGNIMSNLLEY